MDRQPLVSECKSLTTKLRALIRIALIGQPSACKQNLARVAQNSVLRPTLFFLRKSFYLKFVLMILALLKSLRQKIVFCC